MGKKPLYVKTIYYGEFYKNLVKTKQSFSLVETSYTKKINNNDNKKYIFNTDGTEDTKKISLISKVRTEATEWMGKPFRTQDIKYFDLFRLPDVKQYCFKIDVKSAYWTTALKLGIISNETHIAFLERYQNEPQQVVKSARLAILGSLATKKTITEYDKGIIKPIKKIIAGNEIELLHEVQEEPTRPVYLHICKTVDELMQKAAIEIPGAFYYYWDCVFVQQGMEQKALEFFKDNKYEVGVQKTKIDFVTLYKDVTYLITANDHKQYMVRSEDYNKVQNIMN